MVGVTVCVRRECGGVWYGVIIFMCLWWSLLCVMVCYGVMVCYSVCMVCYSVCYGVIARCVTARKLLLITASVR